MWEDMFGNEFENEDEVCQDAFEKMDIDDYAEFGDYSIQELLSIIFQNGIYDNKLEAKLEEARNNYIEWNYNEIGEDEEDDN